MFTFGVNARIELVDAAFAAGAAYVEPVVAGNLVVKDESGGWIRNPAYKGPAAPSFAVLFPGELRLSDPAFPREAVTAYIEAAMPIIAAAGQPGATVVFGSGAARMIHPGVDRAAGEAAFAAVVRQTDAAARKHGLNIIIEPLQQGETNLIHTIEQAIAFLDRFGIGLPVVADLYHIMLEHEPLEAIRRHASRIGHAHVADSGRVPPGQGDWPIREFLEALKDAGYAGNVSIECKWKDFAAELPGALAFMQSVDP
jgi:sugar phosphate isomerase/epimerase